MLRHLLALAVVACFWSCSEAQDSTTYAQCEMMPSVVREDRAGNEVRGSINLRQIARGMTEIRLNLTGFNTMDGEMVHGFHIHEFGDMGLPDGCGAMGGHYNPLGVDHGAPSDMPLARMVGDLGNIAETPGSSTIVRDFSDYMVQLSGDYSVIGRGMIVHSTADDLGLGGNEESLTTGNAGSRVACCVIGSTDGW